MDLEKGSGGFGNPDDNFPSINEHFEIVYNELKRLAQSKLNQERRGYLENKSLSKNSFMRLAATVMERFLTDWARARKAEKRGGGASGVPFNTEVGNIVSGPPEESIIAISETLTLLQETDRMAAEAVRMKHFLGLSKEEIANALDTSVRTVERNLKYGKAWIVDQLK